ncbi:hypothetical protein HWV62_41276 [Athelia sp. TMB]|nr:hypothetical protein HWV62_41276 [Athelia sp. TMB]
MRFSTVLAALALSAVASASTGLYARQSYPDCAIPCLEDADLGDCAATDNACLCADQAFVASTTACIAGACSGADLASADALAQELCAAAGVTLTGTPAATGARKLRRLRRDH